MCAVPAQVAGVERIAVATPPAGAGVVAAAAELLGLDEVWALGGPPAIAAFAYGTESIARVDKVVGPGNAFVNEAKLLVSRDVAIDLPAGPSEIVVVVGRGADARIVELELAAQAEHGAGTVCRIVEANGDLDGRARRGRGARARARDPARRGGAARRPDPERGSGLRRARLVGRRRRLRDRRKPRAPDRRPRARGRRDRPRDVHEAGHGAAAHAPAGSTRSGRSSRRSPRSRGCPHTRQAVRR